MVISEFEPLEAFALLEDDDLDLALTYDYNLAPAAPGRDARAGAAVDVDAGAWRFPSPRPRRVPPTWRRWADRPWIVNSRNTADHDAARTLGQLAGFTPRISHRIDSLDLVEELIVAGHGVGLLPLDAPSDPAYACSRWPTRPC